MSAHLRLSMSFVLAGLGALATPPALAQQAPAALTGTVPYRVTLLRAAAGKYDELLAQVRQQVAASGGLAVRHSQGDQWDFAWLAPVPPGSAIGSAALTSPFAEAAVAWQEDLLVRGPALDVLPGFLTAGLYHFEMFDAAPGRLEELVREREMENAYVAGVGRPRTLIFRREFGAAWDVFTVGAYRDWRHYAERELITPAQARAAAVAAGFASEQAIGPYMRTLILSHHDTLGGPIR